MQSRSLINQCLRDCRVAKNASSNDERSVFQRPEKTRHHVAKVFTANSIQVKKESIMKNGTIAALLALLTLFGTCAYAADCNSGGRYEDMGDGTVTDCRTGLIWLKNANCSEPSTPVNGVTNSGTGLYWKDADEMGGRSWKWNLWSD